MQNAAEKSAAFLFAHIARRNSPDICIGLFTLGDLNSKFSVFASHVSWMSIVGEERQACVSLRPMRDMRRDLFSAAYECAR